MKLAYTSRCAGVAIKSCALLITKEQRRKVYEVTFIGCGVHSGLSISVWRRGLHLAENVHREVVSDEFVGLRGWVSVVGAEFVLFGRLDVAG